MQQLSYRLFKGVAERRPSKAIAWGGSQMYLPVFLLFAFVRALWLGRSRSVHLIYIGDSVLAPLGALLQLFLRAPIVVTAHGLDVTFPNVAYQFVTSRLLPRLSAVIAVSRNTRDECIRRGVRSERCWVVPVGIDPRLPIELTVELGRERLEIAAGITLANRPVLLTVGRLVSRKGVAWFVDEVLSVIVASRPDVLYVIVGEGPDRDRILATIRRRGLGNHAVVVGGADRSTVWAAYQASDLVVFPNIRVPGDVEGFGIVVLEACLAGRCVVASDLEGLRDAVASGVNGELVPAENAPALASALLRLLGDDDRREELGRGARQYVIDNFGWSHIVDKYLAVFDSVTTR